MSHPSDAAPPTLAPPITPFTDEMAVAPPVGRHTLRFGEAVARLERHRNAVRVALGVALVVRLLFEYNLLSLLRERANLEAQLPVIGLALLSYLVVLWFLTTRTRDRFGFGMALGIGIVEATYLVVVISMQQPFALAASWGLLLVAAAHLGMAATAFHASTAFPPHDSKRPWIAGFITAVVFVAIPWFAPTVIDLASRAR
jgi:hypothetical protein